MSKTPITPTAAAVLPAHGGNGNPNVGPALHKDLFLRANRGVRLGRCSERGLLARPLGPTGQPNPQTVVLPLVPAHALEYASGFLRHVWRVRGTSAVWWLYVHPRQHRWWAYCPPQLCAERDVQVDATFKGCPTPDPELWLAGSLRSVPPDIDPTDSAAVDPLVPPHEGVHFVLDLARPLTCLAAFLRTDQGLRAAPAAALLDDPLDQALAYLSDRLMFRTRPAH